MRILLVNKYAHVTAGADRHCLGLTAALRARGHSVAFLSTASEANVERTGAFVPGSVTHSSREALTLREQGRVVTDSAWNRRAARAADRLVHDFAPDVVHLHKLHPQLSIAPAVVAGRRVPVVQTVHDYELVSASPYDDSGALVDRDETRPSYRLLNTLLFPLRRLVHVRHVDRYIAVSRFVARAYARRSIECTVLPNFVERRTGEVPSHESRSGALFAGSLTDAKGVPDVLELARRAPELPVRVAGSGRLADDVRREAGRLANLTFLGRIEPEEVLEHMSRARVVLMPSRWSEPGALGGLEAMTTGTPVITYDRGGLAEYVSDAGSGRVVSEGAKQLVRAAGDLHDDPAAWSELSRNGLRAAVETHSPEAYVDRLERVYAEARAAGA